MSDQNVAVIEPRRTMSRREIVEAGPKALDEMQQRGLVDGNVMMGTRKGGVKFENMLQVMEFARLMSTSDIGVPSFFRGNPGLCLRICVQSDAWGFDPYAVADKAYAVESKGEKRLSYESQLIHAVIERHAPLEGRLRHRFDGEGADMTCTVTGQMIGEANPFEWTSPPFGQIRTKNSPEWVNNPKKQLYYHTSRDWARVYCPDVLLGVYSRDELDGDYGPSRAREVNDELPARLAGESSGPGFDPDNIARTLSTDEEKKPEPKDEKPAEPVVPVNEAEYETHVGIYVAAAQDADDLAKHWKSEKKLRTKCSVMGEVFDRCKALVDKRIKELANG
jgi:RecT family